MLTTNLNEEWLQQAKEVVHSRVELLTQSLEIKELKRLCARREASNVDMREELEQAKKDRVKLEKQVATLKRLNRDLEGKPALLFTPGTPSTPGSCYTPRSRTNRLLRASNLNPKKIGSKVKRSLELYYTTRVAMKGMQDARTDEVQPIFEAMLQEEVFQNSRLKTRFAKQLSFKRYKLSASFYKRRKASDKASRVNKRRVTPKQLADIVTFYMRPDNARCCAGKAEYTLMANLPDIPGISELVTGTYAGKYKVQNYVLTDTIANIYEKYVFEAKGRIVSATTFYSARPAFVQLVSFLKMRECLCTQHQNFAHLLQGLRVKLQQNKHPTTFCPGPDSFVRDHQLSDIEEMMHHLGTGKVIFGMWAKHMDPFIKKERHQMLKHFLEVGQFRRYFLTEFTAFKEHVHRVKAQYVATKEIKDSLKPGELAIHMDFAESYSCRDGSSVTQCAHWNKSVVCIHPMVVYYHDRETESTKHETVCYLSHCDKKDSIMVFSILKKFFQVDVPKIFPTYEVKRVYYVTDGPTSQYRNKFIFWVIANHKRIFKCECQWHYLEAGHGKGPCDGVGGTLKRDAYEATKQGKLVSNAGTFYHWAKQRKRSRIHYGWVDAFDYTVTFYLRRELVIEDLASVYGTFKLHAAVGTGNLHELAHRVTSCTCPHCRSGEIRPECQYKITSTIHAKSSNARVLARFCDRCSSPMCICLMKAAIMREQYVFKGALINAPGKTNKFCANLSSLRWC